MLSLQAKIPWLTIIPPTTDDMIVCVFATMQMASPFLNLLPQKYCRTAFYQRFCAPYFREDMYATPAMEVFLGYCTANKLIHAVSRAKVSRRHYYQILPWLQKVVVSAWSDY